MWLSDPGGFYVTRHEFGHNYGQNHHGANSYDWRVGRGFSNTAVYDGWDMMSAGNQYMVSDLPAYSKWHYNWITDDAVVMMQPEGSTSACPQCKSSLRGLILKPFDDGNVVPSAANQMAVHIPVMGDGSNGAYSYWLSYRGAGNDGKARQGLSVHTTRFMLGSTYGAQMDSLNFDAFGDTATTSDSFILPNTCYLITPPGALMDVDATAPEQIQPIVCVDDIDVVAGTFITISVTFLQPSAPPVSKIALATKRELGCSLGGSTASNISLDVSNGNVHLLTYVGTGTGGKISLSLCREPGTAISVTAYFYDS